MTLTVNFKEQVLKRVQTDPEFREALFLEALDLMLNGDIETGKSILRDYINATIGFGALAERTGTPSKSLMRMLGPKGNPAAKNLMAIISTLSADRGLRLSVRPKAASGLKPHSF